MDGLARRLDCRLVFLRGGRPIRSLRGAWRAACSVAGLGEHAVRVHDLARNAARNLIRAGVPGNIAIRFTGYQTSADLPRYHIVMQEDLARASDRLGEYLARRGALAKVVPLRRAE